jgi:hypothetical protein
MINAFNVLKERSNRSVPVWQITSDSISKAEDFTPMETNDNSAKITIELLDEQPPSTMKVVIPSNQKGVRATHVSVVTFEPGVNSNLQFFISSTESLQSKLCYTQLTALLNESLIEEEEHLKKLPFEMFGERKFVLCSDVFNCLIRLKRYSYSEREVWLLSELKRELNFDYGQLTIAEQLNYMQNYNWFLLRTVSQTDNELFKRRMVDTLTSISEASRLAIENKKL